jgi:ATP-dependent Clp protease ATP-binding subunit ClpC
MTGKFTQRAQMAIKNAESSAADLKHGYVGTEHFLLGLLSVEDGVASKAMEKQGVSVDKVVKKINEMLENQLPMPNAPRDFTPRSKKILELSVQEALKMGTGYIGTEHILLALMKETDCIAVRILLALNVNFQKLYYDIMNMIGEGEQIESVGPLGMMGAAGHSQVQKQNKSKKTNTPVLDQYSRDLTDMARENRFDPIVGRAKEIERVIQILSRRTKNNPCLIGEPGVGKTAIAEGLAQKIVEGNVPETIRNKRVVTLDLSSMVAGSKYRGEFEDRIKKSIDEVKNAGNIILFIDEIHTLIGAGAAEGAIDASNILKPSLARGEIQLIGATTIDEYRKHIEKDAALERRFQIVTIEEPSEEEAIEILKGLKDKYEAHHNVKISTSAIEAAVVMSSRYITDRYLPDKAIDLIDEAASRVRLKTFTAPPEIKKLEIKIDELEKEKESAIKTEEYEKAGDIKQKQGELKLKLEKLKTKWEDKTSKSDQVVDEDEIADIVSISTGIPVKKLANEEGQRLRDMEQIIHQRIVGQEQAVTAVAKAIRRGRVGLKDPKRPIGSFLFLGPTGVGKTELTKALAEVLFGDENAMIRIDMSEYMEKHTTSKLIGSPPGYVGYEEGGQLSEKVRRKPYSVILFDEIEKAHPDVFNMLLQVLDDGQITDSQGRKVNFKNTVIIMTSNIGARTIIEPKKLGFVSYVDQSKTYEDMKKNVMSEVKQVFRPEFLNRIDDVIVFEPLDKPEIKQIVKLLADELIKRIKNNMNIQVEITQNVVDYLAETGFDQNFGARPIKRAIQSKLEDAFAEEFLEGKLKNGSIVLVDYNNEKITFESK